MSETNNTTISGTLYTFFETGMEGVDWQLENPEKKENARFAAEVMEKIETGDHLKVVSDENQVVFDSIIVKTTTNNRMGFPSYAGTQQVAGFHWCYWLQHGIDPDFWAHIFDNQFKAELTKNVYSDDDINEYLSKTPCTDNKVIHSKKIFNQCHMRPLNEKPAYSNNFLELEKEEFENEDLDYYNAQLFFLKFETIKEQTDFEYIWLTTDGELNGFNESEYSLDSYPNDDDFKHFTNVLLMDRPSIFEFLPKDFPTEYFGMTQEQRDQLDDARKNRRKNDAKFYKEIQSELRTFKMKHEGKYLHSCLIKFR